MLLLLSHMHLRKEPCIGVDSWSWGVGCWGGLRVFIISQTACICVYVCGPGGCSVVEVAVQAAVCSLNIAMLRELQEGFFFFWCQRGREDRVSLHATRHRGILAVDARARVSVCFSAL